MPRPSVMKHTFSQVPRVEIPRSSFNRSHGHKTTFDAGFLVPIYADEALPGDTFSLDLTALGRLATPLHPFMDNLFLSTFFFFVPLRLIWDNFEKFMGSQDNPADSTDFVVPQFTPTQVTEGTLSDYLGVPIWRDPKLFNSLHHRAYNLIWNEWFRDQNLQNSVTVDKGDGPDAIANYVLLRRGKRHDYFTSCLPWPQKGDSVQLLIDGVAPVTGLGKLTQGFNAIGTQNVYETGGTGTTPYLSASVVTTQGDLHVEEDPNNAGFPGIYADLSSATSNTINQLRQAFQIQRLYERDARGGTRYTEVIRSHFGVSSPDQRLQRPEYLGGGSSPINVAPVPQTSSTDVTSPQGNLAAYGTVQVNRHGFTSSFVEHGVLLGLACVHADLTYQQGLDRMFSRQTRFDYYWPVLAQLGEQAVLNKEIFMQGMAGTGESVADNAVFGYQERYAEYRYKPSRLSGQMKSDAGTPLDTWHLAQDFATLPVLNSSFIEETPPVDRVIAVPSEPHIIFDGYFRLRCARPMPLYGVPGMIDHF